MILVANAVETQSLHQRPPETEDSIRPAETQSKKLIRIAIFLIYFFSLDDDSERTLTCLGALWK